MAVAYKGNIVFGLVQIPVTLHTATRDLDVRFNQLHRGDHRHVWRGDCLFTLAFRAA